VMVSRKDVVAILLEWSLGAPVQQIARQFNTSCRTVERILKSANAARISL
jgi:hypothetical protein